MNTDKWSVNISATAETRERLLAALRALLEIAERGEDFENCTFGQGSSIFYSRSMTISGPPEPPLTADELRKLRELVRRT